MPKSSKENKEVAKVWCEQLKPVVVVDIGVGQGTYSILCREKGQKWIGVEAWAPYIEQFNLESLYNKVVVGDINYLDLSLVHSKPDLVIIGDVLEHMDKSVAETLINKLLDWSKDVIISVPLKHLAQDAWQGNFFEIHKDHWHHKEMVEFMGSNLVDTKTGKVLGYYLCRRSA
jgi:2-polyprenyl-3-methyl-5-hydroxy-6-metoxy-1,4-benzoquinol methylase